MRKSAEWMTITDDRILEHLFEKRYSSTTPTLNSTEHFPDSDREVTVRCDILSEYGLIRPSNESEDEYEITSKGIAYLSGDLVADELEKTPPSVGPGVPASWMEGIHESIIEELVIDGPLTDVELTSKFADRHGSLRESIRSHVNDLCIRGLARYLGQPDGYGERTYESTSFGKQYFEGTVSAESPQEYVDRIIDLSLIGADDVRHRNAKFLQGDAKYDIRSHESQLGLKKDIWGVRCGDINNLLRRFPRDPPLLDQCALWMRAWTGKHFFPDANHRTAIAILRNILLNRGFIPGTWSTERSKQAIRESKRERTKREYTLDSIYERDSHFVTWKSYFIDVLPQRLLK